MIRLLPVSAVLGMVFLGFFSCSSSSDGDVESFEASHEDYEELLEGMPDSVLDALNPIDTLFLAYDLERFARQPIDTLELNRTVDSTLASMTLDQKIGQLFIVNFPDSRVPGLALRKAEGLVEEFHVGGFLVSRLMAPRDVFEAVERLQKLSNVPLFFSADYERGVGRHNNALTELPSNMAIGAVGDTLFAAAAGRLTAIESRVTGINLVFAPVVDVNNNPRNPIINVRSYGEDPEMVGRMAAAFVREAEAYGVLTTLKHFPGHGNTTVDSHSHMGVVESDREELDRVELRPYEIVLSGPHSPAGVMSTHLWIRALDEEPLPATFSRAALRGLLRDALGFEGFVVTDDVKMGALQNDYDYRERTVRPLIAGADIVLTPANVGRSIQAVKDAIRQGRLSEEGIDASVRRILKAKARAGLFREPVPDKNNLNFLLDRPRGAYIAQVIADRAVTLLKSADALPLRPEQKVALVQLSNVGDSPSIRAAMDRFERTLGAGMDILSVRHEGNPSQTAIVEATERAENADVVVLSLFLRLQSGRGDSGLHPRQETLVRQLLKSDVPVVLVTFGNPYAVTPFSDADALVVTYDQSLETADAVARVLRGEHQPTGKLPITVDPYPFGAGMEGL